MGMAAILVMWPRSAEQTFVPPSHGGSVWSLTLVGSAVSGKMIKECGRQIPDADGRTTEPALYYKLTYEPEGSGALNAVQVSFYGDVVECLLHMRTVFGSILSRGKR